MNEFVTAHAIWIAPTLSALILLLQIAQAKIAALSGTVAPTLKKENGDLNG